MFTKRCLPFLILLWAVIQASNYHSCLSLAASTKSNPSLSISNGLLNHGNTCYMNSQLECAYHIPFIRDLILSTPSPKEITDMDDSTSKETSVGSPGLGSVRSVFRQMMDTSRPVSTLSFCRSLGINPMEQQDAQEFWKLLLPQLNLPELTDVYQGSFEDFIVAQDGSGRERRKEEPFLDLSLEVSSGSVISSLKQMFGQPELLSNAEGNGWRPEKGADKVDALKGSLLRAQGLPSLLQLHLKRFNYDWQRDLMSKINDRFRFPKVLDLSKVCTDATDKDKSQTIYDLQSIVVHTGQYGSGHYYAYIRPDVRRNEWFRFDDDRVTRVKFSEVQNDAFGGKSSACSKSSEPRRKRRIIAKLFGFGAQGADFGWGGQQSSAYMLQYVRRDDLPLLFKE
mmetsp:Transcript_36986/g.54308  ORF Transcript_36986/g.54308 Transcript_36986/m.54308 type:complete len:396 (+) Transcript_36986:222-1409(+)|eukprot:CAMPEP_0195511086 /NCGR_PEP_ID=MMETSP0794_2-20130614/3532_1 /TAXON_ID=515487 /ORGANISM="Stephanopyxis turris, Strain CCMP 815" /LENGTH=395 /DNA_ID=CAMNT_0040638631 /DNA_START=134 /DNA_END=1321 /DNA_ORIENTATION=-